jgi:hypothetical protein
MSMDSYGITSYKYWKKLSNFLGQCIDVVLCSGSYLLVDYICKPCDITCLNCLGISEA